MNDLVLMHGALGTNTDLMPLATELKKHGINAHTFTFSGHGANDFSSAFGIEPFTVELEQFISTNGLVRPNLLGYSMGGYVALNYAAANGTATGKIITLGTKFNWANDSVNKEISMLQPEFLEQKAPEFLNILKSKHGAKWRNLLERTCEMMKEISEKLFLTAHSFKQIEQAVLLCRGDKDRMVTLDETVTVYGILPRAQLCVLPGTAHALESVNVTIAASLMAGFINQTDTKKEMNTLIP